MMNELWLNVINLGVVNDMPIRKQRSIRNLNILSICSFPFPFILALLVTKDDFHVIPFFAGTLMSLNLLMLPFFNYRRLYFLGKMVHYIIMLSGITLSTYYYGFGFGIELTVLIMFLGAFTFSEDLPEVFFFAILSVVAFIICIFIGYNTKPIMHFADKEALHITFASLTFIIIFFSMLILRREQDQYEKSIDEKNRLLSLQKEELQAQNESTTQLIKQVSSKNREITSGIAYANRIQQVILPSLETIQRDLPGTILLFKPRNVVSGDFYWHYRKADKIYLAVADCTGHGVSGALLSMLGSSILSQIVQSTLAESPALILKYLDIQLSDLLNKEKTETSDGMEIVLFVLDKQSNVIRLCSANRKFILFRNGLITEYRGSRYYIGKGTFNEVNFIEERITLQVNDQLYLYTDGITDQFDNTNKKKFGTKQLRTMLEITSTLPIHQRHTFIDSMLQEWQGQSEQTDDILLMGIQF